MAAHCLGRRAWMVLLLVLSGEAISVARTLETSRGEGGVRLVATSGGDPDAPSPETLERADAVAKALLAFDREHRGLNSSTVEGQLEAVRGLSPVVEAFQLLLQSMPATQHQPSLATDADKLLGASTLIDVTGSSDEDMERARHNAQVLLAATQEPAFKLDKATMLVFGAVVVAMMMMKGMNDKLYCDHFFEMQKQQVREGIALGKLQREKVRSEKLESAQGDGKGDGKSNDSRSGGSSGGGKVGGGAGGGGGGGGVDDCKPRPSKDDVDPLWAWGSRAENSEDEDDKDWAVIPGKRRLCNRAPAPAPPRQGFAERLGAVFTDLKSGKLLQEAGGQAKATLQEGKDKLMASVGSPAPEKMCFSLAVRNQPGWLIMDRMLALVQAPQWSVAGSVGDEITVDNIQRVDEVKRQVEQERKERDQKRQAAREEKERIRREQEQAAERARQMADAEPPSTALPISGAPIGDEVDLQGGNVDED